MTTSGFNLLGRVSQYPASQNYGDSPNNNLQIDRSVIIGNYLYTISQSEVMVSNLSTFSTVSTVALAGSKCGSRLEHSNENVCKVISEEEPPLRHSFSMATKKILRHSCFHV